MLKYYLEFIINVQSGYQDVLQESMRQLGKGLEVNACGEEDSSKGQALKIQIYTDEPTVIFDACRQFGRIRSVKISEATN